FDKGIFYNYVNDVRPRYEKLLSKGFEAINSSNFRLAEIKTVGLYHKMFDRLINHILPSSKVEKYDYKKIIKNIFTSEDREEWVYPTIIPRWDKTPRLGKQAYVYTGSTPALFEKHVRNALDIVKNKKPEHRIIFLQAWNEWGEGNYMEPDLEFGHGYLDALKKVICDE
ncbi:MAG: glycoside hydrolase family 99-like domain-containing protein, partial [Odoribacter sp.]|nr:glycoside hydrolase family 99-like domain-containing protein [Odoribacter sp.]